MSYDPNTIPEYFFYDVVKYPGHYDQALKSLQRYMALGEVKSQYETIKEDKQKVCDLTTRQYHRWQNDPEYQQAVENRLNLSAFYEHGYTTITLDLDMNRGVKSEMSYSAYVKELITILHKAHAQGIHIIPVFNRVGFDATYGVLRQEGICSDWHQLPKTPQYGHPGITVTCTWCSQRALMRVSEWVAYFSNRPRDIKQMTPELLAGPEGLIL